MMARRCSIFYFSYDSFQYNRFFYNYTYMSFYVNFLFMFPFLIQSLCFLSLLFLLALSYPLLLYCSIQLGVSRISSMLFSFWFLLSLMSMPLPTIPEIQTSNYPYDWLSYIYFSLSSSRLRSPNYGLLLDRIGSILFVRC